MDREFHQELNNYICNLNETKRAGWVPPTITIANIVEYVGNAHTAYLERYIETNKGTLEIDPDNRLVIFH